MSEIKDFIEYLRTTLEEKDISSKVAALISSKTSTAGARSIEEVFTREFLSPAMRSYFTEGPGARLGLSPEALQSGLGTEGYKNVPGFGFTPARQKKHFFYKTDLDKTDPPLSWLKSTVGERPRYQTCPDFALRSPLPMKVIGEVKIFEGGGPERAVKDLFSHVKQAIFYQAAYCGEYEAVLLVVADFSKGHEFSQGLGLIHDEILKRFGVDTNIYLLDLKL